MLCNSPMSTRTGSAPCARYRRATSTEIGWLLATTHRRDALGLFVDSADMIGRASTPSVSPGASSNLRYYTRVAVEASSLPHA